MMMTIAPSREQASTLWRCVVVVLFGEAPGLAADQLSQGLGDITIALLLAREDVPLAGTAVVRLPLLERSSLSNERNGRPGLRLPHTSLLRAALVMR